MVESSLRAFACAGIVAACLTGASSDASTLRYDRSGGANGPAITQVFLDDRVSVVNTVDGGACVLSVAIEVSNSTYANRQGDPLLYEDIVRSVAASAQFVQPLDGDAGHMRIQFKYPLSKAHPIKLSLESASVDLRAAVEASGDSVRIDDPDLVDKLRAEFEAGGVVHVGAVSSDTGNYVVDALRLSDFTGFDNCIGSGVDAGEPRRRLSIDFDVVRSDDTLIIPEKAAACQMSDANGPVHEGVLSRTTGFFSQTRKVYAVFDDEGDVAHVYVPGIFEARALGDGRFATDVSRAADGNAPLSENAVKGCLGMAPVMACVFEAGERGPSAPTRIAACDDMEFFSDLLEGASFTASEVSSFPVMSTLTERVLAKQDDPKNRDLDRSSPAWGVGGVTMPTGNASGPDSVAVLASGMSDLSDVGDALDAFGDNGTVVQTPIPAPLALLASAIGALLFLRKRNGRATEE